jgi:NAD(P)-dependent dehydrogenase (short-subunit alcohol dehydrogenase family)
VIEGKVVLVTGAAMGIGRYIAHTFAQAGAQLVVADVAPLEKVSDEIRAMDAAVLSVPTDVRDEGQVRALVDQALDHYGRLDVLVNNAGIVPHFQWGGPRWPPIRDLDLSFWDKVLDTNLGGTVLCTKHALRPMRQQGEGHILNLYGGGRGSGGSPYVVSKEAIRTFTRYVAVEEEDAGVCIVCLSPGAAIATENAPAEARARMPGPDLVANRFVLAAQLPIEYTGHLVDLQDGQIVIASGSEGPAR